jgi:hypothetical protein
MRSVHSVSLPLVLGARDANAATHPLPPDEGPGPQGPGQPGPQPPAPPAQPRLGIAGLDRRTITLAVAALVIGWLVLVFGRAIAQSNEVAAQAGIVRMQDANLAQQVLERQSELSVIQSPAFLALEARAYGYGKPREQVFALQPGAPPPPALTPLGAEPSPAPPPGPLEAWLRLLIGH